LAAFTTSSRVPVGQGRGDARVFESEDLKAKD